MSPTDLWPALVALALALISSHLCAGPAQTVALSDRHSSIDGLRGYLAFGVFLHHAGSWNTYRVDGTWSSTGAAFHHHAGKGGVALFFMITAFLFFGRVLDARTRPIDWSRLAVGRVTRLLPAYLLMVALLLAVVAVESGFQWREPVEEVIQEAAHWLLFTFPGRSDINGLERTHLIVSGITWSLPYEWMFYACLPMMALLWGCRTPLSVLVVAALMVLAAQSVWKPAIGNLAPFVVGMAAAVVSRWAPARRWSAGRVATAVTVLALCGGFLLPPDSASPLPQLLQALAFVAIACGNDLGGVLSSRASRRFGESTYSMYLLHGLVLYVGFRWVLADVAPTMSATQHWLTIWAMSPIVVVLSHVSHRWVEMPGMAMTDGLLRRIRAHWPGPGIGVKGA